MRLITKFQAATLSITNLRGLLREIFNELAKTAPDSAEHRNALASLKNIQTELASRVLVF